MNVDRVLDARGLQCPMPLAKDFQGWAKVTPSVELLAQQTESNDGANVYVHYVKRAV